jgi:hypothetical protein
MRAQQGAIMPMVTIGMLALFGLAALGLDAGVVFWDKSRLQNAADAAALSAAKILDSTKDTTASSDAGVTTFNLNANAPGNAPLAQAVAGGLIPAFEYSAALNPFSPGSATGPYVRATAANFRRVGWFSQIFGFADFQVDATAVAGPSPTLDEVCDIVPVMVCADPAQIDDDDPSDGSLYGYPIGSTVALKLAANHDADNTTPGNFFLIRLGDSAGADVVRDAFAGVYESCTNSNGVVPTEPGNEVGPVRAGVNTRFEPCGPPIDCDLDDDGTHDILPDRVVGAPMSFSAYKTAYANNAFDYTETSGKDLRRILKVTMADCSGMSSGATSVTLLDIVCFFLIEPVGPGGTQAEIHGEFLGNEGCSAKGNVGPAPGSGPGPYKIQLYKDPDGPVS